MEGDGDQTEVAETDVFPEKVSPQTSPGRVSAGGAWPGGLQSPSLCGQSRPAGRHCGLPPLQVSSAQGGKLTRKKLDKKYFPHLETLLPDDMLGRVWPSQISLY